MSVQRWTVTVPLRIEGPATAIQRYAVGLQAQLEAICSRYQPEVKADPPVAVFVSVEGSRETAIGRAVYWLGRGVQKEHSLPWRGGVSGMVDRGTVEAECLTSES